MAPKVLLLLSVVLTFHASQAKLDVIAEPPTIVANPGEKVQLRCVLQVKEPLNMKDFMIQWYTRGKQVAEYDNKIVIDKAGLSMSLEALKKGDATLTIASFTPEDAGNYRCYVYYASDHVMKQIVLSVNDSSKPKEAEEVVELSTCETVLDKKLDKVIDLFNKFDGKLDELTKNCPQRHQVKSRK